VRGTGDAAFLADFPLDSIGAIDDTFTDLSSATVLEDLATIMVAEKIRVTAPDSSSRWLYLFQLR
jgi:hypothetical protein